ncbi:KamA family radical SAM protein [Nanoarchaeota archaeon]
MDDITIFSKKALLRKLWKADPKIRTLLKNSKDLYSAREHLFQHLDNLEELYFDVHSHNKLEQLHIFEKENAKECIRVFKNIIHSENEAITGFSALQYLIDLAKDKKHTQTRIDKGFLAEFIALFKGINGKSSILKHVPDEFNSKGRRAALKRSKTLDSYSRHMTKTFKRFSSGYDKQLIEKRKKLKKQLLKRFKGTEKDWQDHKWHINHVIRDEETLQSLVKLNKEEILGVRHAEKNNIPFEITPYYLSLFNKTGRCDHDRVMRSQVIPTTTYTRNVVRNREEHQDLDFMGEKSTSPIACITRRYPQIVILKPYDSCPQICVYCQRNWEIKNMDEAHVTKQRIKKAIDWIRKSKHVHEVLITGGDPLTMQNKDVDWIIGSVAKIKHVDRIRIGTRTPVTLPFRFDDELIDILGKYHELGRREVAVVTHFEHPSELTPDSLDAIKKIKSKGISVYNQQVFTYFNSRRFETCFLRKTLKKSGIDPYYSFNTKGKEETVDFRVPMARIEQERKEEARLLPGLARTDEPVFNVPKMGKSHLRAWQDHEPIMIRPDGKRIYRFYPWESKLKESHDYLYTDVSIYDYLKRLEHDGEKPKEYSSIWYYF